jgi:hypothetical protein
MHSCRADKCIPVQLIGVPTVGFGRRRSIVVYLRVDARIVSAGEFVGHLFVYVWSCWIFNRKMIDSFACHICTLCRMLSLGCLMFFLSDVVSWVFNVFGIL